MTAVVPAPETPTPRDPARPPAGATRPAPPAGRPRRPRRWHRAAVPFLVLALLYLVTGVAHAVQEPDLDDPGTMSPTGTGPDGSSRLAELLAAKGVTITRVTGSAEALAALGARQRLTVFVPAPDLVDPRFYARMRQGVSGHRLVLVRPGIRAAAINGLATGLSRWAARSAAPRCGTDFAEAAGPATVLRSRYLPASAKGTVIDCYDGGLVGVDRGGVETVAVGATDPFRNSRIGEGGNESLATALLSRDREVVWLDLHKAEPVPVSVARPQLPRYEHPDREGGGTNPMWSAFPPVLWAALALLSALALLVALVRGRRLGPPVAEPLPVVVPATETVTGRGRLYRRIRSRPETLEVLRSAALRRMAPAIDPAAPVGAGEEFVAQVAARTGIPPHEVYAILHPAPPETDNDLNRAVARLDALVATVLRLGSRPAGPHQPDVTGSVESGGTT